MAFITKKHTAVFCCMLILSALLLSCSSVPAHIDDKATAAELLRNAQKFYDAGNYAAAEHHYNAVLARSTSDIKSMVLAEYELAHMYVKLKKWTEAKSALERILAYYEGTDSSVLPPSYKKLAEMDLAKIPEMHR